MAILGSFNTNLSVVNGQAAFSVLEIFFCKGPLHVYLSWLSVYIFPHCIQAWHPLAAEELTVKYRPVHISPHCIQVFLYGFGGKLPACSSLGGLGSSPCGGILLASDCGKGIHCRLFEEEEPLVDGIPDICITCSSKEESANHLFIHCGIASSIWS